MKKVIVGFLAIGILNVLQAQTLFTIDGVDVDVKEFERVYTKNNVNNQADYSQASLEEYLELYMKFRMKVAEAEALQMDTIKSIKDELATYRKQLAKNYLTNREVTENILQEAYERYQTEIDASHILIMWPNEYPSAKDSANILRQIKQVKAKFNGKNFDKLAQQYSQDPSAKDNQGRLGYLTAFQTIYPFENAMYNTPVGKVSEPVATRFGYHLVYVHDKRPTRGKIKTAHLLIKSKESDSESAKKAAAQKINKIYEQLSNNEITFEVAVKQYSEDTKTKFSRGELPELSANEMLNEFADAVFMIEEDGGISQPVKTSIGWHIVKRISIAETPTFNEIENDLKTRISRDARSNVAIEKTVNDSKEAFGFKTHAKNKKEIFKVLEENYKNNQFDITKTKSYKNPLFTIGDKEVLQHEFAEFLIKNHLRNSSENNPKMILERLYQNFENQKILQHRESNLELIDKDFKNLMKEYRDGILLFELTNNEVWSKAVSDTAGLKSFHEKNKEKYMWGERLSYDVYTASDEKTAKKLEKQLKKGKDKEQILSKLNKKNEVLKVKSFKAEKDSNPVVKELEWQKGFTKKSTLEDNKIELIYVNKIINAEPKLLKETRGYVISDYQDFLEKEWIDRLRAKYPIKLYQEVFNELIKK